MKFRTEIELRPAPLSIDYSSRGLFMGSCFADHMAARLSARRFPVACNPCGVMYNPLSIASALEMLSEGRSIEPQELLCHQGRYLSMDFHGSFSDRDPQAAADKMNRACRHGAQALQNASYVALTLGTAWVYEYRGRVAANCHKLPASEFTRRLLGPDEICGALDRVLNGCLRGKQVILTLSPVRHLKDGAEGNSLSKALLRVAAARIAEGNPQQVHYFPAYEIVCDDLRDYRFYAQDLCHPSDAAVEYVWERFCQAFIRPETMRTVGQVEKITAAAAHRPFDRSSPEHQAFCRRYAEMARQLTQRYPLIDLSSELEHLCV